MSKIKYVWKSIRVQETDYDGCYNCIHDHDSEDVCRVRGCVHAIGQIKDFYKRATKTHDNTRETHACDNERTETHDLISRKAAIDRIKRQMERPDSVGQWAHNDKIAKVCYRIVIEILERLPSAEQERVWHPVDKPPVHHKDVIVRGVEAIGNVTVHKVMQWDVDTWRPTNYAPSITWTEWSEI